MPQAEQTMDDWWAPIQERLGTDPEFYLQFMTELFKIDRELNPEA